MDTALTPFKCPIQGEISQSHPVLNRQGLKSQMVKPVNYLAECNCLTNTSDTVYFVFSGQLGQVTAIMNGPVACLARVKHVRRPGGKHGAALGTETKLSA